VKWINTLLYADFGTQHWYADYNMYADYAYYRTDIICVQFT